MLQVGGQLELHSEFEASLDYIVRFPSQETNRMTRRVWEDSLVAGYLPIMCKSLGVISRTARKIQT